MIYTYITTLLRILIHTQILITATKLHLVSATQAPSWQEPTNFNHQKLKFSILSNSRTHLNKLYIRALMQRNFAQFFMIAL